ncbi:MAG: calcium/sodium antiporter [Bacteroidales bacterium]|nr:calcium/sodium antiporter [Bacteroidales bacterium]
MASTLLLLIFGLALVIVGADALVDGATAIAVKMRVTPFVIGITVVAIGTSLPELVVSVTGAAQGISDVAIGNIIGSNIFNTAIILGISALICPVLVVRENVNRDMLWNIASSAAVLFFGIILNQISRWLGLVFLALYALYIFLTLKKQDNKASQEISGMNSSAPIAVSVLKVAAGLVALIFGGRLFVDNAVEIAHLLGWSEKFIAITILAAGTSLPELATGIIAASKGQTQLALGNVVGSNIANVFLILGVSAMVNPLAMANITSVDYSMFMLSPVLIFLFALWGKGDRISRPEGALLVTSGIIYMVFLTFSGGN